VEWGVWALLLIDEGLMFFGVRQTAFVDVIEFLLAL
jgi:hypothetical protein